MTACTIRYRLDGPGPAAFLVECDGRLRLYTRGMLGGVMPRTRLLAVLAERGCRWIPASGTIELDLGVEDIAVHRPPRWPAPLPVDRTDGSGASSAL
ncbi:MAG TPA: hypothetical protein VFQ80_08855 [Thermomicrobiales bacterium]|jgi:hypothetical protein|nr:hypothetical protein [Thermomicrobiales bacterium]